jgi:hypothetical protein
MARKNGSGSVMHANDIPIKTAAGQREVGQRGHKLSPRARSLLIMVHGTQTVAELSRSMQSLGDVGAILGELQGLGLISIGASSAGARLPEPPLPTAEAMPPAQEAKQLLNQTAVAALGLRAFLFTLKLEHCYTAEELRAIIPEYRRVVAKAKGNEFADAVIQHVEMLLAHG